MYIVARATQRSRLDPRTFQSRAPRTPSAAVLQRAATYPSPDLEWRTYGSNANNDDGNIVAKSR